MMIAKQKARRARDLGWIIAPTLESGPHNAITDLPGVLVGHSTLIHGDPGPLAVGRGPVRTGVTAIRPHPGNLFTHKVTAAVHVLNGFGKTVGLEQVRELGRLETPILLTNTLNVWRCADYLLDWMLQDNPGIGIDTLGTLNPLVGECNDGWLNDIQGRHVGRAQVFQALDSASSGPVSEGNLGAGTGTLCFGFKGGIGTASRVLPPEKGAFTVGVLLQSNFGARQQLSIRGLPVGEWLKDWPDEDEGVKGRGDGGSCVMVVATNAPLSARQLGRLARRAPLGLARTGFTSSPGSGDYVIAFSTHREQFRPDAVTAPQERLLDEHDTLDLLFQAVVEATEEAVLNSLAAAETLAGRDGHVAYALQRQAVGCELLDMNPPDKSKPAV
jgi:D-aminopeptidase